MPLSTELPERLRQETRDLHLLSERSGVMAQLLAQRLERSAYCSLLRSLHAIYAALEGSLVRRQSDPLVAALQTGALVREASLASDLSALHGPGWRTELAVAPAAHTFAHRLLDLARRPSPVLVAHAYVRYLGDLHGGQILKKLVAKVLQLQGDAGTAFYDFGDEARVLELRLAFRRALAQMPVTHDEVDLIVAEARWSFEQHVLLFEQLTAPAAPSV